MALAYTSSTAIKARAGITDSTSDTLLATIATQVNDWVEDFVGRPIGPTAASTAVFDGTGTRWLPVPWGIRSITTLKITEDGVSTTLNSSDYSLYPPVQSRRPNEPPWMVRLSEDPVGNYGIFPKGDEVVEIVGEFGWAAIPASVQEVADVIGVRAFQARNVGQVDQMGFEGGQPVVSRYVTKRDMDTLRRYAFQALAVG